MLSVQPSSPRSLIRDPLELNGRGYPTEGHDRTAAQRLMITQANTVLGNYESLLSHISPYPNNDPQGPIQALVEVTTRLSQAALAEDMGQPLPSGGADLTELKTVAESGVRFIEAHLHQKLAAGDPAKTQLARDADRLLQAIAAVSQPSESSESSVASSTNSERSAASANSESNKALFEQLRAFVRHAKPHFSEPGDKMTGALGKRATDLHSVLFAEASPQSITMRKIAARSAVIFAAHDFVSKPHVSPQQRQRVLHNARQLVTSIDAFLTQPALRLGGSKAGQGRPGAGWLKGLMP